MRTHTWLKSFLTSSWTRARLYYTANTLAPWLLMTWRRKKFEPKCKAKILFRENALANVVLEICEIALICSGLKVFHMSAWSVSCPRCGLASEIIYDVAGIQATKVLYRNGKVVVLTTPSSLNMKACKQIFFNSNIHFDKNIFHRLLLDPTLSQT